MHVAAQRRSQELGQGGETKYQKCINRAKLGFIQFAPRAVRSAKSFEGFPPMNRLCPPPRLTIKEITGVE